MLSGTLSTALDYPSIKMLFKNISKNTKGQFRTSVFQFRTYHVTELYNVLLQKGNTIISVKSNTALNVIEGRSQFNFQSGNYSNIADSLLNEFILKTQLLSGD